MAHRHAVHRHLESHAATAGHAVHAPSAGLHLEGKLRSQIELHPLSGGLTKTLLQQAMPAAVAVDKWCGPLNLACTRYGITKTLRRMAAFLGHIGYESGNFAHVEENLNYKDPKRINQKFGAIKTDEEAAAYARNPEGLANKVYAHKAGNGDVASGDGWRFRGRGLIQLTGRGNYAAFAKDINVDVVKNPELVATPAYAALSAAWFWKTHHLNELADAEMYQALSKRINKMLDSFPAREAKRLCALNALCQSIATQLAVSAVYAGPGRWF
ncbi:MAG: glycoside hydrolase family 19 protein [Pseudomonadota bacterium]